MNMVNMDARAMAQRIRSMRKYQALDIPEETLADLITRELAQSISPKKAEQKVREKLHQIIAPYLGDPDYNAAMIQLESAAAAGGDALRVWALEMLSSHASTRERIPWMAAFYEKIFSFTSVPDSIADLACGMNPFALPWMNLPKTTRYFAYDLHAPRVKLIDRFLSLAERDGLAVQRDILVSPPEETVDIVFFFKEAHRFEARRRGSCAEFFRRANTHWIVVTLPTENLTGTHQMRQRQLSLVEKAVAGSNWQLNSFEVGNEMVFCIKK